ncbi:MAG: tRNA (5-methylaminomethyl-2-thiouridine)(34)-methyltransferase MnmD [Bacteroidia bacterium]|nr:tRNA (5-methylaminomethyl-2-thiouridine)(34)-methyltransferase MnmD [Bacteroidia bacterium]
MLPEIIATADGSDTLFNKSLNETYHSVKGALTESLHVFLKEGFMFFSDQHKDHASSLKILEIGFGTGLNTILTFIEAAKKKVIVAYDALEIYPLPVELIDKLSFAQILKVEDKILFSLMHTVNWNEPIAISAEFSLQKINTSLLVFKPQPVYHLIYFDAFGPDKQEEMWSENVFKKMYDALIPGGVLVTYSAKGEVKRNMRAAGFTVSRLNGPPGKRHMVRAVKAKELWKTI